METKSVKEIKVGDRIAVTEPEATAVVMRKESSKIFRSVEGCFRLDVKLETGPHAGEWIKDQHLPALMEVELA